MKKFEKLITSAFFHPFHITKANVDIRALGGFYLVIINWKRIDCNNKMTIILLQNK